MKKSTLLMTLALILSITLGIGGTMAYLQDTDEDVNVMTLGNVKIEQIEKERIEQSDDKVTPDNIQDFTQGKPLYPVVGTNAWAESNQQWPTGGSSQMHNDELKNVVDKFVFVENTGKSDAYVRTIFAFEAGKLTFAEWDKMMHWNINGVHWDWNGFEAEEATLVTIDGNNYFLVEALYLGNAGENKDVHQDGILPPGETTRPSLLQFWMDWEATNETMEAIDGNKNGTYDILVVSQAVQTMGFEKAQQALDTAFGEITVNSHPWMDLDGKTDEEGDQAPDGAKFPVLVSTADELVAALEDGKDVILTENIKIDPASMSNAYGTTGINVKNGQTINGGGYTIDIKGAGGTWDSGINTTGGLIRDLTVTGSFRGIFINHNSTHSEPVILDNVTIEGTTYTISCDQGLNQTLTAKNSTFKGWTSFAATLGNATFIDCYFGGGNGYAYCRPYAPTAFVGCEFEAGYTLDPRAAVTFENCTLDGQPLTADNLDTLVTKTDKATVK